MHRTKLDQA